MIKKRCNRCGERFPLAGFHRNCATRDGRTTICKSCVLLAQRKYHKANREKAIAASRRYYARHRDVLMQKQREYKERNRERLAERKRERATGFSADRFAAALRQQKRRCAICRVHFGDVKPQAVHADHCHRTGTPRGVLCQTCNTALGKFRDDPVLLRRAAAYLEEHK
jgi:hypothetical protein